MTSLEALNTLSPGWTGQGTLMVNPCSVNGGIIDQNLATGDWFVIFNNEIFGANPVFFEEKNEAVSYFAMSITK